VRMPGPSCTEYLRMSKTTPSGIVCPDIAFLHFETPVYIPDIGRSAPEVATAQALADFGVFGHGIAFPLFYVR